jgi:Immunoglobulin domain
LNLNSQGAVVVSGSTVTFSCTTNATRPLRWIKFALQSTDDIHIYNGESLSKNFTDRHNVSNTVNNVLQSTLVINNVKPHDAGKYECWQIGAAKCEHTFELVVLGEYSMFLPSARPKCFFFFRNSEAQRIEWRAVLDYLVSWQVVFDINCVN